MGLFEVETLHRVIREIPKPVIAAVNGYAIGGGNVLHVLCDLTIAADTAVFGQTGPRVGSFDAGFGTSSRSSAAGTKQSFNSDTEHLVSIGQLSFSALTLFADTPEAREGVLAFAEKRRPDFAPYRAAASR